MWTRHITSYGQLRPFITIISSLLTVLVGGFALFLYVRTDRLMNLSIHDQAAAYCDLIIHTKEWNSAYGGVYVEKRDGIDTNPYLRKLGVDPDVPCAAGKTYTLRNHAVMLSEISRMSERSKGVTFRLTSQAPIDPANAPDTLETVVLQGFAAGNQEYAQLSSGPEQQVYRYMRPLIADRTCLKCHMNQGYAVGNVIGAVSIAIPVTHLLAENRTSKTVITLGACAAIAILAATTYFSTRRLVIKLDNVQRHLVKQATMDELTGLMNRRNIMKLLEENLQRAVRLHEPLSIMIIDLDHFKKINDTYGHLFGDEVLKSVASAVRDSVRSYDTIGRIGGEEFLIISPGIKMREVLGLAERIRGKVCEVALEQDGSRINMTVSVGVTTVEAEDLGIVSMLKRADRALYQAKEGGRNRVVAL